MIIIYSLLFHLVGSLCSDDFFVIPTRKGGYLQSWISNIRDSLSTLLDGLKIGSKNGHIDNAAICGSLLCSYSLFSGEKLSVVEDRMKSFASWAQEERLYGRYAFTVLAVNAIILPAMHVLRNNL